jgi:ketosteroid isomerase-like protein
VEALEVSESLSFPTLFPPARLIVAPCLRDTHRVMSEESTTPDLVELTRRATEATNRRDLDAVMSFYRPDSVWETHGMGTFEGLTATRGFFEDWIGAYEEYEIEAEEILDLGNGVVLAVVRQGGRPAGSSGDVRLRYAEVVVWLDGLIAQTTSYTDIDQARADAGRLAEARG